MGKRGALWSRLAICAIGSPLSLFSGCGDATAQGLPEAVIGKAQVYDGVTFDLLQDTGRYRTLTRIRLETVDSCELRQKARHADVDWPCGAVATAWLTSRTLSEDVQCRPTRLLSGGGYRAQCYVSGTDLAAAGLSQGMYVIDNRQHEYLLPGYAELEATAKAIGSGIWSSEFMTPTDWRRANGTYNPSAPQRW